MKKPVNKIAIIHDLCGIGKVALTNIIPVLSIMGIEPCPIPTLVLSTHTGGFGIPIIKNIPGFIDETVKHYKDNNIKFKGIFVGYLGNEDNIISAINFIKNFKVENGIVLFDPICGDNGKLYSNFNKYYVDQLKCIIKLSDIITPNFTEACYLTNSLEKDIIEINDVKRLCIKLSKLGSENIIITSVPSDSIEEVSLAIYNSKTDYFNIITHKKEKKSYPGTGDIFASVLLAELTNGNDLEQSVIKASNFVVECIKESSKYDYDTKEGVLLEKCLKKLL